MRGKNNVDVSQVFLVFCAVVGDIDRTATALDLDPEFVRKLAEDEGWISKIEKITLMSKSGKPGDFERAQNRALAWVQGHQLRRVLSSVIARFEGLTPEEIIDAVAQNTKTGTTVSMRFFADLASALEKANALCFNALGDTVGERSERGTESDEVNSQALHLAVISALNSPVVKPLEILAEVRSAQEATVKQLSAPHAQMSTFDQSEQKPAIERLSENPEPESDRTA